MFVERLDESVRDSAHVYLVQPSGAPLTELAFYANTLASFADRNVRISKSPKDRPSRSAVQPKKLHAHAVISGEGNDQKNMSDIPSKT